MHTHMCVLCCTVHTVRRVCIASCMNVRYGSTHESRTLRCSTFVCWCNPESVASAPCRASTWTIDDLGEVPPISASSLAWALPLLPSHHRVIPEWCFRRQWIAVRKKSRITCSWSVFCSSSFFFLFVGQQLSYLGQSGRALRLPLRIGLGPHIRSSADLGGESYNDMIIGICSRSLSCFLMLFPGRCPPTWATSWAVRAFAPCSALRGDAGGILTRGASPCLFREKRWWSTGELGGRKGRKESEDDGERESEKFGILGSIQPYPCMCMCMWMCMSCGMLTVIHTSCVRYICTVHTFIQYGVRTVCKKYRSNDIGSPFRGTKAKVSLCNFSIHILACTVPSRKVT
jgi:hypothetical protein